LRGLPVLTFESYAMLFQAASAELGVGLAPRVFIQAELTSGTLVPVSAMPMRSKNVGYMVFAAEKAAYPPLDAFRRWLFGAVNSNGHG
jgi:LysR family glycine cleavage system transcriptional activator